MAFGLIVFFGALAILAFVILILPALITAVILTIIAIFRAIQAFRHQNWAVATGHLATPMVAAAMCLAGFLFAKPTAIVYAASQLRSALAIYRAGIHPSNDHGNIEIISADPAVAAYLVGYSAEIAAPGVSRYIILDETGRFAELADKGRARELAATPELKSRSYGVYCNLFVKHEIGPYYIAFFCDVDGCDPH